MSSNSARTEDELLPVMFQVQTRVAGMEDVLLWREQGTSMAMFGAGLYAIICLYNLPAGLQVVQLSTLGSTLALAYLLFNFAGRMLFGRHLNAAQASFKKRRREAEVYQVLSRRMMALAEWLVPALASVGVLAHRHLSADSFMTSFWVAASLWTVLFLGEIRIFNQAVVLALVYLALFTLPYMYMQSRRMLDALLEDVLKATTATLLTSSKFTLLASSGAGAAAFACLGSASMVVRASLAVAAFLVTFFWQLGNQAVAVDS